MDKITNNYSGSVYTATFFERVKNMDLARLEPLWNQVQKPAQYTGGELGSVIKDKSKVDVRFALCFPDIYEIGMSHLGSKILYSLTNNEENYWCERAFAPNSDMEVLMRQEGVPLYGLESLEPLTHFDFIGFTLQYELSYPTILNMLDLAGIPLYAKDRTALSPLVMGGGPCACNPEPLVDFFDLFVLGEGEELNLEVLKLYEAGKKDGWSKEEFLEKAAQISGVYVPSLYEVDYSPDGLVKDIKPMKGAPAQVRKRIVEDLDSVFFPEQFVVPYIKVVHDRTMLEVLRGCIHGCRFCQAGFIYRPYREKSHQVLAKNAEILTENTGYEEISLTSLSTSDHSQLELLLEELLPWTEEQKIGLSLPSLRINSISPQLLEQVSGVRKSGLTFAPEAGTQRLRDVINKNITEEEVLETCRRAFSQGYTSVKLYFMMGLPTETDEDILGIGELAQKVVDLYYGMEERPTKGRPVTVTLSASCFVPKPFTPFQFEPQDTMEEFNRKQQLLKGSLQSKRINYRYHDSVSSVVEAVLARGDRRLGPVLYEVWTNGAKLDSWSEHFSLSRWQEAIDKEGLSIPFYAQRKREYTEVFPWSHLDYGVSHAYFVKENKEAYKEKTTLNCNQQCLGCGATQLYSKGEKRLPCL